MKNILRVNEPDYPNQRYKENYPGIVWTLYQSLETVGVA
jgi:hypothetical protein